MRSTSAFVTGASGHIGRSLAERLGGDWEEVRGVDLQTDKGRHVVAGDISEPGGWQRAAAGSDVVFHTDAALSDRTSREVAWRNAVLGTRHALEAAISGGARRFVHLSSVRVFGDGGLPDEVDEQRPVRPNGDLVAEALVAAEQVVLQAHSAGEVECVVIRAADVYGPESRQWTIEPLEAIRRGRFVLPAGGSGVFSPLFVDDLLEALELAAKSPGAAGRVFTVSDGAAVSCREFFGHYHRMLGRGEPRAVPSWVADGLAGVGEAVGLIAGYETQGARLRMRYLARTGTYSIERARELLSFEPRVDLAEGMRRTEAWLREQGLLDGERTARMDRPGSQPVLTGSGPRSTGS